MSAHTVITHAQNQGTGMSPVDVGAVVAEGAPWTVPAYVVRGWITRNLRKGRYAQAATLSTLLHGAVTLRTGGVSLGKATDRPNGVVMCPSAWELDRRGWVRLGVSESVMPMGAVPLMDRNDLRALRVVLGVLARMGG